MVTFFLLSQIIFNPQNLDHGPHRIQGPRPELFPVHRRMAQDVHLLQKIVEAFDLLDLVLVDHQLVDIRGLGFLHDFAPLPLSSKFWAKFISVFWMGKAIRES